MAGGVTAAAPADGEAPDVVGVTVTVDAGPGLLLLPQADSAVTVASAPSTAMAADLWMAGIWHLHEGESSVTGVRARDHPVTNRNLVMIVTAPGRERQ